MVKVLNIKALGHKIPDGAVYIGRAMPRYGLKRSPYANPYPITKWRDRTMAICNYRYWLEDRISEDPAFLDALRDVQYLVCWCAPAACHGDVIVEFLRNNGR